MTKYKIIFLLLVFLKPFDTLACKCIPFPELSYFDIQKSDLAFIGTCQKVYKIGDQDYAIFNISLLLKGNSRFQTKVTVLSSNNGSGDCMQTFEAGEKWLVIAKRSIFGYYASLCDNNSRFKGNDLAFIRIAIPGYPFSSTTNHDFFYDKDEIRIRGKFIKGKEEGYWYYYYRHQLKYKILYHTGRVKELHKVDKNYYKLVLFKNGNIIKVKDVGMNERRITYIRYTPKDAIITYFLNGKFDFKMTVDSKTHYIVGVNREGAIISRRNYFEEFKYYPGAHINPIYQFFMKGCGYLDRG
ncbi:hypothetical protein [Emticicia fontis]